MSSTLIMTSSWWLAAPPLKAWQLINEVAHWPRWWRSVRRIDPAESKARTMPGWRTMTGWPLRLRVTPQHSDSGTLLELVFQGDLHGRSTWLFGPGHSSGTEVTCRWELALPKGLLGLSGPLVRLVFEQTHLKRMRNCASDMGAALECRVLQLREWSGAWHH